MGDLEAFLLAALSSEPCRATVQATLLECAIEHVLHAHSGVLDSSVLSLYLTLLSVGFPITSAVHLMHILRLFSFF